MSENNTIYEIAQIMSRPSVMQKDMQEATALVMNLFQEKYFGKLNKAIERHHTNCMKKPSKEVQLLKSMKPFMPEDKKHQMDRIIDMMVLMDTAGLIKTDLNVQPPRRPVWAINEAARDGSIHDDGIYDMDDRCLARLDSSAPSLSLPGIFFLVAMMNGTFFR